MKISLRSVLLFFAIGTSLYTVAQPEEDLLSLIGDSVVERDFTSATFKSTRVINLHSNEQAAAGEMDFRISHRFGFLNTGAYNLFGMDQALMRFGFEYGITDKLMAGIGRSNVNKAYDAFAKYKIIRQQTGKRNVPVSVSYFGSIVCNTIKWPDPGAPNFFTSRLFYTHQLLIARKFNEQLSLLLAPGLVHRNWVETFDEKNDVFNVGIGGRYRITKRFAINGEYIYNLPNQLASQYANSFSLGCDIETGGHVFQLHLTNSTSMTEPGFITESVGKWSKGGIHFGFNVSRIFNVHTPKKKIEE
ncbi:MAG: hypothetical protein FJX90_06365 [Bacteroidetes bacterium]|nr:hypothetical protein [Bacteroidota bacterium]